VTRWRWLAAGGATVLAAVVGVVLVLQATGGAACAAVPAAGTATFYTLGSGGGNCSYPGPPADGLFVALSPAEYAAAGACGGYLDVTGPRGTVRVEVTDQCPECATGHVDLSRTAFARIASLSAGQVPVTYRAVTDPPLPGPLSFRVKEGSSAYWLALLVINHGDPLRSVEARSGSGAWHALRRTDYNYWLAESGLGGGPFGVRVTDTAGHQATAAGIRLAPGTVQATTVPMYGGAPLSKAPPPPPPPPSSPSPSPTEPSVSRTAAPGSASYSSRPAQPPCRTRPGSGS
jgi:expansin (peptidoglycan-binding protein)